LANFHSPSTSDKNFATPTAFWWAALALPIVVFYILKIRMRRIPVSTIMFWQQVFEEKQPRSLWQTLRHWLSLLLQLVFLFLLVGSLTDPFFASEEQSRRRLVVVLDNSASMQAADVQPSRFAAARKAASDLISSLRVKDEMAIISAGTQPKVVCGLTGHQRTLRDALRTVEPSDGPTEVAAAVELARRLLAGHENAKVVVLSDGCFDKAGEIAAADDVVWQRFGGETGNVAITRFQVRRSVLDPIGFEVFIEVRNLSAADVDTRLELTLGEDIVDVIPLKLAAGETWKKVFEQTAAAGGRLTAAVDHADALAADNTAVAILPERKRIPVVLVSAGHLFLERVLVANSLVDLKVVAEPPSRVDPGTIVVYHKLSPAEVPDGNVLFIDPEGTTDLWETGDAIEQPIVATQDKDHALMSHVRLDNVLMPEARRLKPKEDATVLVASAEEDPLYFAATRPGGNVLVLTVNLDRGDLPLRTAFPILMTNALNWFTGEKGELQQASAAGDVAEVDVTRLIAVAESAETAPPPTAAESGDAGDGAGPEIEAAQAEQREFVLTAPDGTSEQVTVLGETATIGPLDQCGVWTLSTQTGNTDTAGDWPPALEIACNLSNPRESDLRGAEQESKDLTSLQAGLGGKPVWFYLALVACALVATEWYLYQRRWIT
jgi:hypothetical protein